MQPRQGIIEIFSTFVQFDADEFNTWVSDAKLRRSIKNCLEQSPSQKSEDFWVLYWYKIWQIQSSHLAAAHISAYLQEVCYWVARKMALNFKNQSSVADFFQIAISRVQKILKRFNPEYSKNLKAYAEFAFEGAIKDSLRLNQEIDICSDCALLHKISRKRLVNSLTNAGLNSQIIDSYVLAWECFKEIYTSDSKTTRKLAKPDSATWQVITDLYNRQRLSQLSSATFAATPENLEKWLSASAKATRDFLFPKLISIDAPSPGQESGSLVDTIPNDLQSSLITEIAAQEEAAIRQQQQAELNQVLTNALAGLDTQSQKLLHLYYSQKLTQQQIAQQLDIKQYTVSRRLMSIKRSLLLTLSNWRLNTLHISPSAVVLEAMSQGLEEWLKIYYSHEN
ncbi:MAG: sigma-70 family RNA polymerase sigma factor [Mojavia pulchra JT2-VF2]|jgi:RNA polymerase sigma factor (sigma-70 family)|uniref:Sigma-70 family RNA polymerase sigma factor n=1 Tax=Mojavia pulchra JT2-VF2 TaxID=287848 RepID=A0A951UKS8_9NOST|nr:sigma-70 family RNA polymerase sigma factor [Mojavia pulchra JT2-VF2]